MFLFKHISSTLSFRYEYLIKAAEAFGPDIVVVLDHERLFIDLERDLPGFVKVRSDPMTLYRLGRTI